MAPAGTPPEIVDKLFKATAKVLASRGLPSKFAVHGVESRPTASPAEFGKFIQTDIEKYRKLIQTGNIPLD